MSLTFHDREGQSKHRCTNERANLYIVRDEDEWAISGWFGKFGKEKVIRAKEIFTYHFAEIIRHAFLEISPPDIPRKIELRFYHLNDQQEYITRLEKTESILNLDICTNHGAGLNFSREFHLSDRQVVAHGLVERPGFPDTLTQLRSISPGSYILVDDDVATGITIKKVMEMLPRSVRINESKTLLNYSHEAYYKTHPDASRGQILRVVDLHNFLVGSKASGLVIRLPDGSLVRAPYLGPYISNVSRSSVPPSSEEDFSRGLWEMNREFFVSLGDVILADLDPHTQDFFAYLGFKKEMLAADLCDYHLKLLLRKK